MIYGTIDSSFIAVHSHAKNNQIPPVPLQAFYRPTVPNMTMFNLVDVLRLYVTSRPICAVAFATAKYYKDQRCTPLNIFTGAFLRAWWGRARWMIPHARLRGPWAQGGGAQHQVLRARWRGTLAQRGGGDAKSVLERRRPGVLQVLLRPIASGRTGLVSWNIKIEIIYRKIV